MNSDWDNVHIETNLEFIAGGGARTHTTLRPLDFESSASASSATPAIEGLNLQARTRSSTSRQTIFSDTQSPYASHTEAATKFWPPIDRAVLTIIAETQGQGRCAKLTKSWRFWNDKPPIYAV
jgi:hypothetical protein